jgi:hypothetical protein
MTYDMKALAGGADFRTMSQCAIVLEDEPVGPDSRLNFESFPPAIEETYSLQQPREMGGERMPQPAYTAYRGGNWGPFQLSLKFRAFGEDLAAQKPPASITLNDIDQVLIQMERKVRWCQALTFPLERGLGRVGEQILARAASAGVTPSAESTEAIGKLRRNDPPVVLIVFGSWWVQRGYVTNWTTQWEGPFHPVTVRPYGATVNLQIQPIKSVYPTWQLIRDQAGQSQGAAPLISGVVGGLAGVIGG